VMFHIWTKNFTKNFTLPTLQSPHQLYIMLSNE
jgi:hypothetical protein